MIQRTRAGRMMMDRGARNIYSAVGSLYVSGTALRKRYAQAMDRLKRFP
ncbi:MAG: hypothetical protein ACOC26_06015 [Halochromatium sp.]